MSKEDVERLPIKQSVLKKLFAYSGNLCAMPNCENALVTKKGTMIGKIAHIHAAKPGGARFDKSMTDENRRDISNLFIVCGNCHDEIDDKDNEADFPPELLRKIKAEHEEIFLKAEEKFVSRYSDSTRSVEPRFPSSLHALADAFKVPELADAEDEIAGVRAFIEKLVETPFPERDFALQLAQRMYRKNVEELPAEDVVSAFNMTPNDLKEAMRVLEHHGLADIDDKWGDGRYVVEFWPRDPDGNPWFELIQFCEIKEIDPKETIRDLDFGIYD